MARRNKTPRISGDANGSADAHARGRRPNVNYATGDRHGMRKLKIEREVNLGRL